MVPTSLLAVMFLVTAVPSCISQSIGKCGPAESRKFDEVAASVTVIGNRNSSFPTTLTEANAWCSRTKEAVKVMKDFSKKCLDNLSRQVANLIAYGVNKHQRKVCKSEKARVEAAAKLRCLNTNYVKINDQMERFVEDYQRSIRLDGKKKLAGLCCSFHSFANRAKSEARKVCATDHANYFYDFIRAFSSDAIDLLCTNHNSESAPSCKSLVLPEKDPALPPTKSFLPPLLVSLSSI